MNKVVLVTGANSGIGLALCERLLSQDTEGLQLCLACRNTRRGQAARSALLSSHPAAQVTLLQMDTSSISSVISAAREVRLRYNQLDYLYLNAGIMPKPQLDVKAFFKGLFSRWRYSLDAVLFFFYQKRRERCYSSLGHVWFERLTAAGRSSDDYPWQTTVGDYDQNIFLLGVWGSTYCNVITMFATGEGILTQTDGVTSDGLQEVFATNLFGHFLLIRELEPVLCDTGQPSHVIWTSSSNVHRSAFNLEDVQHQRGIQPYSSSKYASDLLSLALNTHCNQQGLYSSVICPGFVMTSLTYSILPSFPAFLWTLLMPLLWLIRFLTNTFTLTPYNGAEALFWLFRQNPESLNPQVKYHSLTSGLGNNYTQPRTMDIDLETSESLYEKLLQLESEVKKKLEEKLK